MIDFQEHVAHNHEPRIMEARLAKNKWSVAMQFQWIPCKIENTGFDSERRFEVDLPGDGKVVGTAYIEYLRDCNHEPIEEGEPPYGKETRGYVMCRVVKQIENLVHVELPGTNVFHVPREALEAIR